MTPELLRAAIPSVWEEKDAKGEVLGSIVYRLSSGNTLEILDIEVSKEHRRQGIGRRMIKRLRGWRHPDSLLIYAITRVSNVAAQEFYEACGFRIVGRLHQFYRTREEMVDGSSGFTHAIMYGLDV